MSWSIKPIDLTHTRDVLEYEPIELKQIVKIRDVMKYDTPACQVH